MIKVVVRVGEKEMPYEFKYMWQVEWLVRILNFVVKLLYGGLTQRAADGAYCDCLIKWPMFEHDGEDLCTTCQRPRR